MLKRVHKQTALSLHKNTTKLTSIDTQVQISEYIGGLNLPSNAVCYARIQVWYPCAVKKLGRNFKRPASIDRRISHPVQSDFCHMQTGGSGIWQFRKFFVSLIWHSWKHPRPDVLSHWKSASTWMSKVCCKALEIKPVPRNPCSPREWFPPESEPPFNACGISQRSNLRCHLLFLWVNTQTTEVADPRLTLPWTATSCGSTQRKMLDSSQCSSSPKPSIRLYSSRTFFSRSLSRSLLSMKTLGFSSISCPRWTHSIGLEVSVTTHW